MLWPKPTAEAGRATHMAPRGRQLGRVQKRRAASCAATAAQGAARRLLLSAGGGPPVAGGAARVGAGAGTSLLLSFLLSAPPVPVTILVPRPAAKANPPMSSPTRAMAVLTGADGRAAARPTPDRTGAVTGSRQAGERAIRQPPPGDRQQHARCRLRAKSIPCLQGAKLRRLLGAARPTQRSPVVVVGTPSLSAGRVAGCRKGRQVEPEGWRLSVASSAARINQRQPVQSSASPPAHAEAAAALQPESRPPPPAHAEAAAARPPPTDRWMEDGPRGGRRQRPSSAQRQRQAGSSSPGRKTGITAGQLDGSGDNWPTINQRQPSRAPRLSSSAHQPCAGSVDAPQPVTLRRCCVKEADRPPRPWTSKTGRHHH